MRDARVLKEAYGRFGRTGPEFEGWLSNHGPMAAEAMVRHGHDAAVDRWIDRYEARLEEAPSPRDRIPVDGRRAALGDPRRLGDWPVFFAEQLDEADWRTVLGDWWPRLLPGIAAGATQPVGSRCRASRRPAGWGPRTGCVVSPACRPRTSTAASTPAWPGSTSCPGGRRRRAPWERRRRTRPWGFLRELFASAVQDHAERAHTGPEELMDVAVRHGDEHLVKLTDTALDVWSWTGDPAALAAVRRGAALIQPPG